ncbi:MAG: hypothetical protein O7D36_11255, partial [Gammaproteobacteria bacterium]|nr:hypothetical protein [Gammaproteobacteria bacterium]
MRKFGLFISFWLASILLPTTSFALGLGEIEVDSFLNQPLDAKIEVISTRPGEVDDLLVTLASRDAFTRAGLSRPRGLSELRFKVLINEEDGTAVVLVTTKKAVKEPFLNFLVEADWAKGRVLREFTVLLDPPFYADTPTPAATSSQAPASPEAPSVDVITNGETNASPSITPEASSSSTATVAAASDTSSSADVPAATSSSASMQQSTTEQQTTTEPIAVSGEPESSSASEAVEFIADESDSIIVGDLEVFKGDTLWSIATQFKDSEHSMSQVMLAIQRLNPESFGDTNINFLLAGTVLRAPTAEQLDRISEAEALAEVLEQNGLWDGYVEYLSETTPVSMAGDGGETGADDTSAEQQSNLSLLAPGEGETDTTGTQGDGEDTSELSRQLAFAEEELDAARIENADLESRIAELEATLSKVQELQKMVEIEDDSLAQLQADQAAEAAALEAEKIEAEMVETAVTEEISAPAEILTEETTDTLIEEMIAVDEEALLEDLLAEAPAIEVVEETTSVAPPAPVIVVESAQEPDSMLDGIIPSAVTDILSSIGSILLDPILLAGLGGILLLVGGLVVYKRWKSGREFVDIGASDAGDEVTDADGTAIDDDVDFTPIHIAGEEEQDQTAIIMPASEEIEKAEAIADEEDSTAVMAPDLVAEVLVKESAAEEAPAEAPAVEEQDDTLNEVDVYLAYGLYDNAEDLLIQSLEASPTRADYRSKLLDTYFATKNVSEFVKQAEALKGMGDAANRHWDRVQVMGYELAPD